MRVVATTEHAIERPFHDPDEAIVELDAGSPFAAFERVDEVRVRRFTGIGLSAAIDHPKQIRFFTDERGFPSHSSKQ